MEPQSREGYGVADQPLPSPPTVISSLQTGDGLLTANLSPQDRGRSSGHYRGDSTVSAIDSLMYPNTGHQQSNQTSKTTSQDTRKQHKRSHSHSQHPDHQDHHRHNSNQFNNGNTQHYHRRPSFSSHHHNQPHYRGHKRTKSAGTGNSVKDLSMIFMTTGMYAHQPPTGAYRSIEYGFNSLSQADGVDSSLSRSNSRRRKSREERTDFIPDADQLSKEKTIETASSALETCSSDDFNDSGECGILSFRPLCLQKFATIQVFVFLSCILVTLNQALSSGYFNSVITTIEKRFDIPSRMTGLIASTFEIGNLITVIFVSYFGTHRHIPKWIAKGIVVTGIGSLVFSMAHFTGQDSNPLDKVNSSGPFDDNICHIPSASLNSPFVDRR